MENVFWQKGLFVIAGPCVLQDEESSTFIAGYMKALCNRLGIPYCFKASFDKANRTSLSSFRGPGLEAGLEILKKIRSGLDVPVLTDIHSIEQAGPAAEVVDVLQIPAFLCRQTDLLVAAARTGRAVNIKKGQFLAPWDMEPVVAKARSAGANNILLTERGSSFGYNNLVSDFRSIPILQRTGCPVIFDATHSVQLPGGQGSSSGGQREFTPVLARCAVAAGCDGLFFEVYPDPDCAPCDGPNAMRLDDMEPLLAQLLDLYELIHREEK
jgi:2-dehydro-3-deoxyphosphooctonate aldolase (KDO 8-P synthase)